MILKEYIDRLEEELSVIKDEKVQQVFFDR
jgi:hypothetical protein